MRAYLQTGSDVHLLPEGDLVRLGKADDCEIQLQQDPFISRRHCSFTLLNDTLTVVDLKSTHGTIVNGESIGLRPTPLKHGDVLTIGNTEVTVLTRQTSTVAPPQAHCSNC